MHHLLIFLGKPRRYPSTIWRLAWLAFCFLVLLVAGIRTLQQITPYVLGGIMEEPAPPNPAQTTPRGPLAGWLLPLICWATIGGTVLLAQRRGQCFGGSW